MFILDTNVISELRKAHTGKADTGVVEWAAKIDPVSLYMSVISIFELEKGVLLIERRDPAQGGLLRNWLEERVLTTFADRILAIDTAVSRRCATLHVPNPRSDRDAMIAATGLVHGMAIATRNVADFEPTGVPVFNPWRTST